MTRQVSEHECKINLYTPTHLYKCRKSGKFVSPGRDDKMSKNDKTCGEHECKINLHTITYQYKCRNPGKFVSPGRDDLMSTGDRTNE